MKNKKKRLEELLKLNKKGKQRAAKSIKFTARPDGLADAPKLP
jgi:hypothetical protein